MSSIRPPRATAPRVPADFIFEVTADLRGAG